MELGLAKEVESVRWGRKVMEQVIEVELEHRRYFDFIRKKAQASKFDLKRSKNGLL